MRSRLSIALVLLVAATAGCAAVREPPPAAEDAQPSADEAVRLEVVNNYTLPMEVFATGSGITRRMGTVAPGIASRFVLPEPMIRNGPVEVFARPSGGGRLIRSGPLGLYPGLVVDFEIGNELGLSRAAVRLTR